MGKAGTVMPDTCDHGGLDPVGALRYALCPSEAGKCELPCAREAAAEKLTHFTLQELGDTLRAQAMADARELAVFEAHCDTTAEDALGLYRAAARRHNRLIGTHRTGAHR